MRNALAAAVLGAAIGAGAALAAPLGAPVKAYTPPPAPKIYMPPATTSLRPQAPIYRQAPVQPTLPPQIRLAPQVAPRAAVAAAAAGGGAPGCTPKTAQQCLSEAAQCLFAEGLAGSSQPGSTGVGKFYAAYDANGRPTVWRYSDVAASDQEQAKGTGCSTDLTRCMQGQCQ